MNNRNSKLTIGIAGLFEIILIITAILSITSKQWGNLALSFLAIVCITLPFIVTRIANEKNIVLPSSFQLISVSFIILAQYFGEINNFYENFWWWDLFLHATFGGYAAFVGLYLIQGIFIKKNGITKQRFSISILIFASSFAIALGTLWEIFEFLGDYFFKTNMTSGGLEDTATDLIVKVLGAFIISIICYYGKLKKEKQIQ